MNERQRQTGRQRHRKKDREWVSERDVCVLEWVGGRRNYGLLSCEARTVKRSLFRESKRSLFRKVNVFCLGKVNVPCLGKVNVFCL